MKTVLDDNDYCRAAEELGCDPAMVKAVAEVESSGSGFTGNNPTILYERHVFYRNAPKAKRDKWFKEHPDLCNPKPFPKGGYGPKSKQYEKLRRAAELDLETALKACSWGAFQELGENHRHLGFATAQDFVREMRAGADRHLDIFVRSIKWRGLQGAMQAPSLASCRKIARGYNGPAYAKFDYHNKIWNKFNKYQGKLGCAKPSEQPDPASGVPQPPPLQAPDAAPAPQEEPKTDIIGKIADADAKFAVVDVAASRVSNSSWLVTLTTKVGGWLLLLWSLATTHPEWSALAVILIVAGIWYLNGSKNRGAKRNADTNVPAQ